MRVFFLTFQNLSIFINKIINIKRIQKSIKKKHRKNWNNKIDKKFFLFITEKIENSDL